MNRVTNYLFVIMVFALVLLASADTARGQAETLPPGRGVVSTFYTRSDTATRFDFLGNRVRVVPPAGFSFLGNTKTDILSIDISYGITRRLEAHLTIPIARSQAISRDSSGKILSDSQFSPIDTGIGNMRFGVRYNIVSEPFFLTAKADIKLSAGSADVQKLFDGTTLPIAEGQNDLDLTGQISKSVTVFNRSLRIGGEAGVRLRGKEQKGALDTFTNRTLPVKPGNEFIYNFQINYNVMRRLSLILSGDGIIQRNYDVPFRFIIVGKKDELKTVGTKGDIPPGFKSDYEKQTGRRIFALGPLASLIITPRTSITAGVLFTVAGRNYPAGQFYVIGISRFF
ncbi:MAG: hypothetical protein AB1489_32245 [Acidobacteriota bacterium]